MRIKCLRGFGDSIYMRPFIRAAAERGPVVLDTPWPELFEDLPVRFERADTGLRTQAKNIERQTDREYVTASGYQRRIVYGHATLRQFGSITRVMESQLPLHGSPYVFDLPERFRDSWWDEGAKPVAVVRPVTVRKEWYAPARNPKPDYVNQIAAKLMETHYVISVADVDGVDETYVGNPAPCHVRYDRGELTAPQVLRLLSVADVAIGGVGWIVPAVIALQVPAFIILGGLGAHNAPDVLTDPRMNLSRISFATPKEFCRCSTMTHACRKEIPDLTEQWQRFRGSLLLSATT